MRTYGPHHDFATASRRRRSVARQSEEARVPESKHVHFGDTVVIPSQPSTLPPTPERRRSHPQFDDDFALAEVADLRYPLLVTYGSIKHVEEVDVVAEHATGTPYVRSS